MPLSPSVINELRAELDYIDAFKQKLNARADVIRAVLEPFDFGQTALPFASGTAARVTIAGVDVTPKRVENKFASTGLRAAILDALRKRGPARAPQVAAVLTESGFKNDSTTSLSTRVYNDLWRMKEAGIVENKDGVFSLKEAA